MIASGQFCEKISKIYRLQRRARYTENHQKYQIVFIFFIKLIRNFDEV